MAAPTLLQSLARLYNLQTAYFDGLGQLRKAPPEAILAVLRCLGAELASISDVPSAFRARRQALWSRAVEPIIVCWQNRQLRLKLRLAVHSSHFPIDAEIRSENGEPIHCEWRDLGDTGPVRNIEGVDYITRSLLLATALPPGYHELRVRAGNSVFHSQLIAAPDRAYTPPGRRKRWGVFCPLYALHSHRSWGAGDFSDLAAFAAAIGELGGDAAATLPMLAGFFAEPYNPSPYAPVSRLFWNEFYLDVEGIPEIAASAPARALMESRDFRLELENVRGAALVDYRHIAALKRRVIELALLDFYASAAPRRQKFESFVAARPRLRDYAEFRARVERDRAVWLQWPEPERSGALPESSHETTTQRYHLYVQWLCEQQIAALHRQHDSSRAPLYLDFPLGVNRDGYDVWRHQELFALQASGGAPPDSLFVKGQNWGFPPQHPEAMRRDRYRYYRDCLKHHMAHASMLRIDHVMGLHRAFWVPAGFSAAEGLYVHQQAAEYYAILSLESHRHCTQIVGENLGTVPDYVNEALSRHGVLGMHVGQFGVGTDPARAVESPPPNTVASLNTHDTPTFMSFWIGADIDDRLALGLIRSEQAEEEHGYRAQQRAALTARFPGDFAGDDLARNVLRGWLETLAADQEEFLLVNLEDLWLEICPQNVPGTWQERPNWQRRCRHDLEKLRATPQFIELLRRLSDIRRAIG